MKLVICIFCLGIAHVVTCASLFAQREFPSVDDIPTAGSESAEAYYDAATGDVYVSVGEGVLILGVGGGAPFGFVDGAFDPGAVRQDTPLGTTSVNNVDEIGWFSPNPADPLAAGVFNIGRLLPADETIFSAQDFDAAFPDALIGFGSLGSVGNESQFNVIPNLAQGLPEPGSIGVLTLAGTLVSARRRRR